MKPLKAGIAKLVVVAGPPCAGKSTIANAVAKHRGWPRLELDSICRELLPDAVWDERTRDAGYAAMHKQVAQILGMDQSVILTATYGRMERRADLVYIANGLAVPVYVIQCQITPMQAVERFRQRSAEHPAVDLSEARVFDLTTTFRFSGEGLVLDTSQTLDRCVSEIDRYLLALPAPMRAWCASAVFGISVDSS